MTQRGLTIVKPLTIDDTILTATDVPETEYSAYSLTTAYIPGDRVIQDHTIYEATGESNAREVTISAANPNVCAVSLLTGERGADLQLQDNTPVRLSTLGTLPSGLTAGTTYYVRLAAFPPGVVIIGTQYFSLAATPGGAGIDTSGGGGSGTHFIELSLNYGKDPADEENQGTYWLEVGPTNKWKLFDGRSSSQTAQATSFYYEVTPGVAIGLIFVDNVDDATSVRVKVTDPDYGVAFDETYSFLAVPASTGWWSWFFGERHAPRTLVVQELPSLPNAVIRLEFAGGADLAVGVVAMGQPNRWGTEYGVLQGAGTGIQDYSRKETDQFGNISLVERAFARKARWRVVLNTSEVDSLENFLASIRATPALFVGGNAVQSLNVFGFYKNFEIVVGGASRSDCELELEGLT